MDRFLENPKKLLLGVVALCIAGALQLGYITKEQADTLIALLLGTHGLMSATEAH